MKSSYRKIKDKLKERDHEIKMLVLYPEMEETIEIYMKYIKKYEDDRKLEDI